METIALHIEYLLRHHDCVILPGFGAFIASNTAARLDAESGVYHAPTRRVCYNPSVTHDDGMLVNSFSRRLGITFEQARSLLIAELKALSDSLYRDSEVTLGRLGVIEMDAEGVIRFRPFTDSTQTMTALGYGAISLKRLRPEKQAALTTPSPTQRDAHSQPEIESEAGTSSIADPEATTAAETNEREAISKTPERDPAYWHISIRKRTVNIAAAMLIMLGVGLIALVPGFRQSHRPIEASMLNVEKIIDTVSDLARKSDTPQRSDSVAAQAEKSEEPSATDANTAGISTPQAPYYLIVASFHSESEAQKYMQIKKSGRYSLQMHRNGKVWLVSAERGDNTDELLTLSTTPEFKAEYTQAWVWKAK